MTYQFLPHTADVIVEIEAASLADVFLEATAVVRHLVAGNTGVSCAQSLTVSFAAPELDELLLLFVRELLTRFQLETFVPASLEIKELDGSRILAVVRGELFDATRHEPQPEVKAVTRHRLSLTETAAGWRAQMVMDL